MILVMIAETNYEMSGQQVDEYTQGNTLRRQKITEITGYSTRKVRESATGKRLLRAEQKVREDFFGFSPIPQARFLLSCPLFNITKLE